MAYAFVGDVHGWSDRLQRLLPRLQGVPVFMGDLIDRGPDSFAVLKQVHALCTAGRAHCVLGNHEFALLRGLGVKELGLPEDPEMFQAWTWAYGGDVTCDSCGVEPGDAPGLSRVLAPYLPWLASLPWYLDLQDAHHRYVVVHAGLGPEPLDEQIAALQQAWAYDPSGCDLPAPLYHRRLHILPQDLPENTWVVSGHTPLPRAYCAAGRILCDTSGGNPDRPLSAVLMPSTEVVTSEELAQPSV